jgi:AraC-like DNA-binding protein
LLTFLLTVAPLSIRAGIQFWQRSRDLNFLKFAKNYDISVFVSRLSKAAALRHYDNTGALRKSGIDLLARMIERHASITGDHVTSFPALSLHRREAPTEPISCIYGLGLGVTIQGGKRVMLGDRVLSFDPGHSMLTTIDSPITAAITRATKREPYLGLLLKLDASLIALLATEMKMPRLKEVHADEAIPIQQLDEELLDALRRLLALLDTPTLLSRVAPLIQQEITIRLLAGPHSAQLIMARPPSAQIARVVASLRHNFIKDTPVAKLAAQANMSLSVFREHFRAFTGISPLQYQKQLRLQEARNLMLNQSIDASRAAYLVGYESVSQFSREYRRQFGPQQDVRNVRAS